MKYFLILTLAITSMMSMASENLIVPTISHHSGTFDYDNSNFGLGFEKEARDNLWFGFVSYNNSYSKVSTMVFAAKRFEVGSFTVGGSIGIADNYEDDRGSTEGGFLAIPLLTAEHSLTDKVSLRLSTSAPFSEMVGGDTATNLSFIIKL